MLLDALRSPFRKALRHRRHEVRVIRRARPAAGGVQEQVEDERNPVAVGDRQHFVRTVRVEGGERQFGRLVRGHVVRGLVVAVANDDLAAGARRRQRQREGRHHAGNLLRVPMLGKETAAPVNEQLVELGAEPFGGQTEALRHDFHDLRERTGPGSARETHVTGIDLPAVADRWVHQCPRALAEGRPFGRIGQGLDLHRRNRERQFAHAFHDDARHGQKLPPACAVVARAVDGPEQFLQPLVPSSVLDALNAHSSTELSSRPISCTNRCARRPARPGPATSCRC